MKITEQAWRKYIRILRGLNTKASEEMTAYMTGLNIQGAPNEEESRLIINYAYALTTKYGEGAAAAACEMYDALAVLQGVTVPPALPAPTATYPEVNAAVKSTSMYSNRPDVMGNTIGRLVKQAGADTTLQNALRDGAEFAWIPSGDTCVFCLTLASRGWQKASKKALKNGHAEHIHPNCDCNYNIRFDGKSTVEGYDPDALYDQYQNAEGRTSREKINALRRSHYQQNKDFINQQKRLAYAKRAERQRYFGSEKTIRVDEKVILSQKYRKMFRGITESSEVDDKVCAYSRQILRHRSGSYHEDLVLLDADTGKHVLTIDTSEAENAVSYNNSALNVIEKARTDGRRILAIHNHPNSLPPTLDDGASALEHGYDIGIVVCHDGTVYTYTPTSFRLSSVECEEVHNNISYQVKMGASIEDVWYNILEEYGMIIERR